MNEADEQPSDSSKLVSLSHRGSRFGLVFLTLLACAAPFTHYRLIHYHLDGVRYPWGLLPAEFLFFRYFGELSAWLPVGLCAVVAWSFYRPASARPLLIAGTVAVLCFTVLYLCYSLLIAFILLQRNA